MIINIRGTNGSGKTWVIHQLMQRYGQTPIRGRDARISGHVLGCGARVVGRYVKMDGVTPLSTGGCDTVPTLDKVEELVRLHARRGSVVFEGLLISGVYGRWDVFANTVPDFRFVFLSTTLEECIWKVETRRSAAGKIKLLNPTNLTFKFRAVENTRVRFVDAGHAVWQVTSDDAVPLIQEWLERAGDRAVG